MPCTAVPVSVFVRACPAVTALTQLMLVNSEQVARMLAHLDKVPLTLRHAAVADVNAIVALQQASDPLLQVGGPHAQMGSARCMGTRSFKPYMSILQHNLI